MNKTRFRLLVFFMSLSLVGIILVQLYWVNSSLKNSDERFTSDVQTILGKLSSRLDEIEEDALLDIIEAYRDSTGEMAHRRDVIPYYRSINSAVISIDSAAMPDEEFIDKKDYDVLVKSDSLRSGDVALYSTGRQVDEKFTNYLHDFRKYVPLEEWTSTDEINYILSRELEQYNIKLPYEFWITKNGQETKIKSGNFSGITSYHHKPILEGTRGANYRLLITFPGKKTHLFKTILPITSLSLVFTLIIIIAYLSAINQLVKQKQISEIKTDFINNMTHEFKTPIATINLALDAIKNPKIFSDSEKVQRYLQMIRDENKRMHAQVENVLQISKLDKRELDITKDQADIHEILENAIEHVHLIIEARQGTLTRHFHATRTTALLNDVHFTNVLVNILDNAIKYSPDEPVIDIYTENVKDFILIKVKDQGLGMSKVTQKRIFEKFFREHTGDIHNVKGHGLGLAYVKRIIDDHNCHIYVESEKGKGSTFIIKMPLIN